MHSLNWKAGLRKQQKGNVNYDLTKGYLDLIVTYASLFFLVSRVDDRKVLLGMYNCAYELSNGS
ncbi:hypothetical protein chiPu_0030445, partial [Chiloscyllium punctatum]|nr:hypothetical protein [Chiloscyllium punctatum]